MVSHRCLVVTPGFIRIFRWLKVISLWVSAVSNWFSVGYHRCIIDRFTEENRRHTVGFLWFSMASYCSIKIFTLVVGRVSLVYQKLNRFTIHNY